MSKNPPQIIRNGVPVHKLFGTLDKLRANPSLAAFRFTARNRWLEGTASRSTVHEWAGAGGEHVHVKEFSFDADHPTLGLGYGPTPQEFVLHALAACITAGIATTAAARKIELTRVECIVQGDIDVQGVLGLDKTVRKGFREIRVSFEIAGNAAAEDLRKLVESSRDHSAVFDMLTNQTPVIIDTTVA